MRTRHGLRYVVGMACLALLVACGGSGGGDGDTNPGDTPTPDSSFDPTSTGLHQETVNVGLRLGQTFTVNTSGLLEKIDLMIAQSMAGGPLAVTIMPVVSGLPDNNDMAALGGVVVFDGTLGGALAWHTVQLATQNIYVTAGQTYAVCLLSATGAYDWASSGGGFPDRYPGGQGCGRYASGDWWSANPEDFAFRAWVTP